MAARPEQPRRMAPDARRSQIIDVTRRLIAERPDGTLTTADVAEEAGVARSLVHHYFRGLDDLLEAVGLDVADGVAGVLSRGSETPVDDRVRHNVAALLDVLEANRSVWLTTIADEGEGVASTPAARRRLRETVLEQMLANNTDIVTDTPWARLCLTGYIGFSDALCREWLLGRAAREDLEDALIGTLLHTLCVTIPEGRRDVAAPPEGR